MRQLILGHRGMVGSALHRLIPDAVVDGNGRDLRYPMDYDIGSIDELYLCAARVGGIQKNIAEPGTMIYDNLMIQSNVIEAARLAGVKLIVFLGSSCIYPQLFPPEASAPYAWAESDLMCGELEPTNEAYAIAKIAGIKMLEAYHRQYGMEYLAVMPCNMYGPNDNFDPETSHFLPGMIRKFHDAKLAGANMVQLWGTGKPRRELMHVDDCVRIITELVAKGARGLINVGTGEDLSIAGYAKAVHHAVGYAGGFWFDDRYPDGTARKLLDVSRMKSYGCEPKIGLKEGLESTYRWFLDHQAKAAGSAA